MIQRDLKVHKRSIRLSTCKLSIRILTSNWRRVDLSSARRRTVDLSSARGRTVDLSCQVSCFLMRNLFLMFLILRLVQGCIVNTKYCYFSCQGASRTINLSIPFAINNCSYKIRMFVRFSGV